jgi:uncharacterized membrane protein
MLLSAAPSVNRNFGGIVNLIIGGPLALGLALYYLGLVRQKKAPAIAVMFDGFRAFGRAFLAQLLMAIFVILWALLLIVPGIIAALGYAMTYYVLADNPGMEAMDALRRSKEMMMGHRGKLFCLGCRFIGWALLGILSLGIGFLWILPYAYVSLTNFYLDLKQNAGAQPEGAARSA